jgi:xanthine dehydrogenase molybdenum-binding subunit
MKGTINRQDAFDRVSGQAVFTRDVILPGMLYGKILLSPYAHARIKNIDTSKAECLVGVRDILKYDDPDVAYENGNQPGFEVSRNYNILTLPRTADHYQHPMGVVVVADSEEICDEALRLLKVEWEEQPFILEMEDALKPDAPKIMPEVKRMNPRAKEPNTVLTAREEFGNVDKGFAEADKVIEYTITRARNTTAGVEPIACVHSYNSKQRPRKAYPAAYRLEQNHRHHALSRFVVRRPGMAFLLLLLYPSRRDTGKESRRKTREADLGRERLLLRRR